MITLCTPANNWQVDRPTDPESWVRNWSGKVRETRCSSNQKRSEPTAHPCRGPGGQAGDEHGGSPWFKGTRGRGTRRLFQQPDLENHWEPMRNRALPSVMAFVAQATHPAGALLRDRQSAA